MPDGSRQENTLEAEGGMAPALNHFLSHFQVTGEGSRYCGLYGYTSFNAVRYLEGIAVKDSRQALNDAPDALYILYRYLIVFNDFNHELILVEMLGEGETSGLDQVQTAVMNRNFPTYGFHPTGEVTSTLTDDEHRANIRRAIAHCLRGDVFQMVLSRRFEQRFEGDDFNLYRALRGVNPSPYLFYFDFGGFRIFGSSPETHYRRRTGLHRPHSGYHPTHRQPRGRRSGHPTSAGRPQGERRTRDARRSSTQRSGTQLHRRACGLLP